VLVMCKIQQHTCIQHSFSMWKKKSSLTRVRWPHCQQPDDLPYQWARMEPLKPWAAPQACHPLVEEEPTGSVVVAFNVGGGV
jgi:hypothetical protein